VKKTQVALAAISLLVLTLLTTGAARADGWSVGSVVTYDQVEWGESTTAAGMLLNASYDTVYGPTGDEFVIGSTTPGYFALFTDEVNLDDFIPASGAPGPLDANLSNPSTSSAGVYAGEVAALKLNLDFSNAGLLPNSSGLLLGNLVLTGFSGSESSLNGMTVDQFFGLSQAELAGQSTTIGFPDIDNLAANINAAFDAGQPDAFAQDHLVAPGSSAAMPEPPTLLLAAVGVLAAAICRKKRALGRPNPI
jgi:hypothetical protein